MEYGSCFRMYNYETKRSNAPIWAMEAQDNNRHASLALGLSGESFLGKDASGSKHGETSVVNFLVLSLKHASRSFLILRLDAKRIKPKISRDDVVLQGHGVGRVRAEDVALLAAYVTEQYPAFWFAVGKNMKASGKPESLAHTAIEISQYPRKSHCDSYIKVPGIVRSRTQPAAWQFRLPQERQDASAPQ